MCETHASEVFPEVKCDCGSYLDLKDGKFGAYFSCINCGNKNFSRVLESLRDRGIDLIAKPKSGLPADNSRTHDTTHEKQEITVRSDDPDYF